MDYDGNDITLKALVDKGNKRVIYVEATKDFLDVIFSCLAMPMGTIIRLIRNQPPAIDIGCMNNLYKSVENLDVQNLQTESRKTMLLRPRSAAESHCKRLKQEIDDDDSFSYFVCSSQDCTVSKHKLLSHHRKALCPCGQCMSKEVRLFSSAEQRSSEINEGGGFVNGLTRLLISDDLQVIPPSTAASFSLLARLGIMDGSTTEEKTFNVGVEEILNLLKCSLISKMPLTETLLKNKPPPSLSNENVGIGSSVPKKSEKKIRSCMETEATTGDGKICVKIIVSKSKEVVCYAEAGEDFVDLLFSFLILPLGYIVKEMRGSSSKGCIDALYSSVENLDADRYMKSEEHKAMLLSPKVAPGFRCENQLLSINEASYPPYFFHAFNDRHRDKLTSDENLISREFSVTALTVMDPRGYLAGPAMFTVLDNLVIMPISPVSGISILNKLGVPFGDVEERIVHVGKEEALRLLLASFLSETALTNTFIQREQPKKDMLVSIKEGI